MVFMTAVTQIWFDDDAVTPAAVADGDDAADVADIDSLTLLTSLLQV